MRQLAADIRRLGETQDDNVTRYIGCWASWWPCLVLGDFVGAEIYFERGFTLYDSGKEPLYSALSPTIDAFVTLLTDSAFALVCRGKIDQGLSRRDAAITEARGRSRAFPLAHALWWGCQLSWCARLRPEVLLAYADELQAVSADRGLSGLGASYAMAAELAVMDLSQRLHYFHGKSGLVSEWCFPNRPAEVVFAVSFSHGYNG